MHPHLLLHLKIIIQPSQRIVRPTTFLVEEQVLDHLEIIVALVEVAVVVLVVE
jgi:hypothetical protein